MQSTDLEEIKAALWDQASHPCTRVSWGVAQVMAVKKSRGQLLVLLRGRSRWHPVEAVTIERPELCPTGACDLEDETSMDTPAATCMSRPLDYSSASG
jgi:hypothetical protein